ncbi:thioredoxin-disulfide reductase [Chelativorans alearense]|uniref:thioredoxin-disulfide reductase n=1 Tax=Chelativorans alearense TaxID=2681495 RepID=UPI0013D7C032|nr:thioredoxin-disulfide reductase [Chelativorans alearense]
MSSSARHFRLLILGSGPAGYTAAIYAARAGLAPALISGWMPGGQLMITTDVENWPADANAVNGPELMARFAQHAEQLGTELLTDQIVSVELGARPFRLIGELQEYTCHALIVATGATARYLGLDKEQELLGRGVSPCAVCDGYPFKGKRVAMVGGGNTAVEEALYMSNIAEHVTVVHRRDQFRADKILVDRLLEKVDEGSVSIIWDHVVEEILSDDGGVIGIALKSTKTGIRQEREVSAMFVAIGHTPNTGIFKGQLEMENGYIVTKGGRAGGATRTSIDGVFAAGDVQDMIYRQAVTSAASGCMAALDAERYLSRF